MTDIIASVHARMMRNIRSRLIGKCGTRATGDATGCYGCRADVVALGGGVDDDYKARWN
jgi:hypothetical protein